MGAGRALAVPAAVALGDGAAPLAVAGAGPASGERGASAEGLEAGAGAGDAAGGAAAARDAAPALPALSAGLAVTGGGAWASGGRTGAARPVSWPQKGQYATTLNNFSSQWAQG